MTFPNAGPDQRVTGVVYVIKSEPAAAYDLAHRDCKCMDFRVDLGVSTGFAYPRKNSSGCPSMYGPTKTSGLCFGLSSSS